MNTGLVLHHAQQVCMQDMTVILLFWHEWRLSVLTDQAKSVDSLQCCWIGL